MNTTSPSRVHKEKVQLGKLVESAQGAQQSIALIPVEHVEIERLARVQSLCDELLSTVG